MQFPDARILIFAKAPVCGQVKTRLIPALGAQGALDLYLECLHYSLKQRCRAAIAPVVLYCTPDTQHPVFQQLQARYPVTLKPQCDGDLGQRMSQAVRQSLTSADSVMLTGADAPALTNHDIQNGLQRLQQGLADVVMGPAEDGGYVMLGMRQNYPELFSAIPWGTNQVAQTTRQRCVELGLALGELPTRWDIDRPDDVRRFNEFVCG